MYCVARQVRLRFREMTLDSGTGEQLAGSAIVSPLVQHETLAIRDSRLSERPATRLAFRRPESTLRRLVQPVTYSRHQQLLRDCREIVRGPRIHF